MTKLLSELAKGAWSGATAYTIGDIVDNDGSSYVCIASSTNNEPPNVTYWALLAQKGADGVGAIPAGVENNIVSIDDTGDAKDSGVAISAIPVKATGAEVDTGSNDTKFLTPKAIEDSSYAKTTAIPVKASGAEVDTGTDDAKFMTAKAIEDSSYIKNTGTSASTNALQSATTTVNVSSAAAPSAGQVLTATSDSAATWQAPSGATDGWTAATGTWTYASASTITVPSGAASLYKKGDLIKWTQTTVKYGVISAVADTLLTIIVNTDYTVANATITSPYYSHQSNPIGFPDSFSYTSTWGANAGSAPAIVNGTITSKYKTVGNMVFVNIIMQFGSSSTYGSGGSFYTLTLPVAAGFAHDYGLSAWYSDNSTWKHWLGNGSISSSTINLYYNDTTGTGYVYATTPFTMSTSDQYQLNGTYLM